MQSPRGFLLMSERRSPVKEIKTDEDVDSLKASGVRIELADLVARKLQDLRDAYAMLDAVYDPDFDGPLVLLSPGDDPVAVTGLSPITRVATMAEHVERHDSAGAWEVILVASNSYAVTYIVPDELPVPGDLAIELARQAGRCDIVLTTPANQEPSPF
jgi:hypothetical protein